jgi:hypothetical protein
MRIANMKYQEAEATLILVLSQPFDALFTHKKKDVPNFLLFEIPC